MVLGCGEGCSGGLQLCEYGWHVYPVATGAELSERPRLMRLVSAARRATVLLTFPHEQSTQVRMPCGAASGVWRATRCWWSRAHGVQTLTHSSPVDRRWRWCVPTVATAGMWRRWTSLA